MENDWQGGGKGAVLDMMNSKVFEDLTFELRLRLWDDAIEWQFQGKEEHFRLKEKVMQSSEKRQPN